LVVDRDRYSDHAAHKTREQLKVVREDCGAGADQITPDQRHNPPCKEVDTVLRASKGVSHQPYWRITIPRDLDDELASRESQPLGGWESRPKGVLLGDARQAGRRDQHQSDGDESRSDSQSVPTPDRPRGERYDRYLHLRCLFQPRRLRRRQRQLDRLLG